MATLAEPELRHAAEGPADAPNQLQGQPAGRHAPAGLKPAMRQRRWRPSVYAALHHPGAPQQAPRPSLLAGAAQTTTGASRCPSSRQRLRQPRQHLRRGRPNREQAEQTRRREISREHRR